MIGFFKGYKLDVHARQRPAASASSSSDKPEVEYYVQIHCWCSSTLSCGEFMASLDAATSAAIESMDGHERAGNHARGNFHIECIDCATVEYVSFQDVTHRGAFTNAPVCRECHAARKAENIERARSAKANK